MVCVRAHGGAAAAGALRLLQKMSSKNTARDRDRDRDRSINRLLSASLNIVRLYAKPFFPFDLI